MSLSVFDRKTVPNKRKSGSASSPGDEAAERNGRRPSSSRQRNHSVRFVSQNSMYGSSKNAAATPRRHVAAGSVASSPPEPHDHEQKDYHVGKFRFEREDSRQPSNSPPMELLALYAERAAKELAQPKLAGYPSPPSHQVKTEQRQYPQHHQRHRISIPSPPPSSSMPPSHPHRDPPSMHTLPVPVRSAIPNSVIPPPTPLSVHRSASEIRLPSIRDLMNWSPSEPPATQHRPQEEEIAHAMMQLASDPI